MKNLTSNLVITLMALLMTFQSGVAAVYSSSSAEEQYPPRRSVRYSAHYRSFNRGFVTWSSYQEVSYSSYGGCGIYATCFYDMGPNDVVYIEEKYISGGTYSHYEGYRVVHVYRTQAYRDPYVTYYIDHNGYVISRRFYQTNRYYGTGYWYARPVYASTVVELNQAEALIVAGAYSALVGVSVLADAKTDGERILGAGSVSLGSLMMALGSQEAEELEKEKRAETELMREIERAERAEKTNAALSGSGLN